MRLAQRVFAEYSGHKLTDRGIQMDTLKDIAYAIGAIIALALLLYGAKLAIAFFYSMGSLI